LGRVRIFAGPNGSGKTCLYEDLKKQNLNLGQYLNADLLLEQAEQQNYIDLSQFNISLTSKDVTNFFLNHTLFQQMTTYPEIPFSFSGKKILFNNPPEVYEVANRRSVHHALKHASFIGFGQLNYNQNLIG
jgi:ABC-type branched-subunit amino acid transport system ATPase component